MTPRKLVNFMTGSGDITDTGAAIREFKTLLKGNNGKAPGRRRISHHAVEITGFLVRLCETTSGKEAEAARELATQFLCLPRVIDHLMSASGFLVTQDSALVAASNQSNLELMTEFADISGDKVCIPRAEMTGRNLAKLVNKLSDRQCLTIVDANKDSPQFAQNSLYVYRNNYWDGFLRGLNNKSFALSAARSANRGLAYTA